MTISSLLTQQQNLAFICSSKKHASHQHRIYLVLIFSESSLGIGDEHPKMNREFWMRISMHPLFSRQSRYLEDFFIGNTTWWPRSRLHAKISEKRNAIPNN